MALIFVPQYELEFQSNAGSDIVWKVEILRSYDDSSPQPSDFLSSPVRLIGTGEPLEIEYERDYDVYKPIQGSVANLNVLVTSIVKGTTGAVEDFNGGGPYEWQLRVRYEDASDTLQDYWCGFFSPLDTAETVNTFPFDISFTAVDGLGLLEQASPGAAYTDEQVSIFSQFIVPALQQVGLDLDIHVDSNILRVDDNTDALINSTASNFARWKDLDDEGELFTYKEILEGWLSAFNCKITQANGRWYIYNASSLSDTTVWKVFNAQGVAQADSSEALVKTISSGSNDDLVPVNQDLQLNLRRPAGSIECKPQDLVERQFAANGDFEDDLTGWTFNGTSSQGAITGASGNKKFTFYQNYFSSNTLFNAPALSSSAFPVDSEADVEVAFDWIPEKIFEDSVELLWQVTASFDSVAIPTVQPPDYNVSDYQNQYNTLYRNWNYQQPGTNTTSLIWSDYENQWVTGSHRTDGTHIKQSASTINEILNVSKTFPNPTSFRNEFGGADISNLRFTVHFFYLVSRDGNDRDGASTSRVRASIDNVSVKNMFANDVLSPTFERVQDDYTHTISYEPLFASSISDALYQKVTPSLFTRVGLTTDGGTGWSLEEIGTQQKLNDFQDRFKYYEGTLLNLAETPLTNINKINLNWSNYTETNNGIMNGGTFRVKSNTWDTAFYIPDQADKTSQFFDHNVNLIPATFPGRSTQVVYTLALRVGTVDDNGAEIDNGLVPSVPFIQVTGRPGQVITEKVDLIPLTGYVGIPAGTAIAADSDSTPLPEYTTVGSFLPVQGNIVLPLQITMPEESEFEELFINAEVLVFTPEETPGVVPASVVITNTGANIEGGNTPKTYDVSGVPGSTVHFTHHISPVNSNFQLFSGNFDATYSDTSLSNLDAVDGMNNVAIDFSYSVPTTTESVAVTVTGNASAAGTVGVDLFTRTVNFGTAPANTSFHESSNTFTGVPSATQDYFITLIPDADYQITSVAAPTLPSGVVANGSPYPVGENWEIPIQVTIPSSNDTVNVTQGAITVSEEPYSLTFNVNSLGISNAMIAADDAVHRITFDESDFGDSITPFVINVNSNATSMFTNSGDIAVDVNESSVVIGDGSTITLPESQFTAAPSLVDGNILITIAGNFPSTGGQYTLDINVVGNNSVGGAIERPATDLAIEFLGPDVPANGGTALFQVTANGTWTTEVMATSQGQSVVSTDGSFSGTYTANNHTISISGAYGPTSGTAGITIIEVSMDALTLGGFQDSGVFQTFSGASLSVEAISPDALPNRIAVGNQLTSTGNINVMLDGVSDTRALTYSANYPNLTFYN